MASDSRYPRFPVSAADKRAHSVRAELELKLEVELELELGTGTGTLGHRDRDMGHWDIGTGQHSIETVLKNGA